MSTNITQQTAECYECAGTHNLRPASIFVAGEGDRAIFLCEYCRGEMEVTKEMYEYWNRYQLTED